MLKLPYHTGTSLCSNPKWYINGEELVLKENVNYLGAILSNHAGNNHVAARRSICRNMYSKQMLGLGNFCKNTPLFQAVMMHKISDIIDFNNLTLFSNIFNTHSGATGFN